MHPASVRCSPSQVASALSIYKQVAGTSGAGGSGGDGGSRQQIAAPKPAHEPAAASRPATPAARPTAEAAREHPPPPPRVSVLPKFTLQHAMES